MEDDTPIKSHERITANFLQTQWTSTGIPRKPHNDSQKLRRLRRKSHSTPHKEHLKSATLSHRLKPSNH